MANITRIKAHDPNRPEPPKDPKNPKKSPKKAINRPQDEQSTSKTVAKTKAPAKIASRPPHGPAKGLPKIILILTAPFRLIFKPFFLLGRYIRDSWREIREVRWPNRKATWKMVFAVLLYTFLFALFVTLLDALFTLLFNKVLR